MDRQYYALSLSACEEHPAYSSLAAPSHNGASGGLTVHDFQQHFLPLLAIPPAVLTETVVECQCLLVACTFRSVSKHLIREDEVRREVNVGLTCRLVSANCHCCFDLVDASG